MSMMHTWFECKVSYLKTLEDGLVKKVTEPYLVDALSFSEAENRIIEEMRPFISGELNVADIKRSNCREVFACAEAAADKWYRCKVSSTTVDERSGKEKKAVSTILVQAAGLRDALDRLDVGMKGTLSDWEAVSVVETALMDVFPYVADGHDRQTEAMERDGGAAVSVTIPQEAIGKDFADCPEACRMGRGTAGRNPVPPRMNVGRKPPIGSVGRLCPLPQTLADGHEE